MYLPDLLGKQRKHGFFLVDRDLSGNPALLFIAVPSHPLHAPAVLSSAAGLAASFPRIHGIAPCMSAFAISLFLP